MIAKTLINQIQTTLEGGTLAQKFINDMKKTLKTAPESISRQFVRQWPSSPTTRKAI